MMAIFASVERTEGEWRAILVEVGVRAEGMVERS